MNDNIDDWLNSLGISSPAETRTQNEPASNASVPAVVAEPVTEEPEPHQSSQPISPEDFNDILAENGFNEPQYNEAEEVHDNSDDDWDNEGEEEEEYALNLNYNPYIGVYDENGSEYHDTEQERDLDAEEDNVWERLEEAGLINPARESSDANIARRREHQESVNISIGDRQAEVPIIPDADMQQLRELEQSAIEAFNQVTQEPLLPLNSPTLLRNDTTSRFSGTEWYNEIQKSRIILAGCGGIGSWAILQLARMNPAALFMYDDDIVEAANMSGQLYCQDDIGKAKVDAMANMIRSYTTMRNIYAIREKYTHDSEAGNIMICGFDSMTARKTFFHSWRKHLRDVPDEEKYKCIYIDGRLSIDTLQVFCITGDNNWAISEYAEKYLFSDEDADATVCSMKQTTYLACMIGSFIVNLFTNWVADTLNPIIPYDLPFFTEYDAQNMIFKTVK